MTAEDRMASAWRKIFYALVIAVVIVVALAVKAFAHDPAHHELKPWFESLKSRSKASCCDGSDATRLDDIDWDSRDGHYRVRLDGQWVDVPEDAVIDGPNLAGPAMVWPYYEMGALTGIRCFMPGAGT